MVTHSTVFLSVTSESMSQIMQPLVWVRCPVSSQRTEAKHDAYFVIMMMCKYTGLTVGLMCEDLLELCVRTPVFGWESS